MFVQRFAGVELYVGGPRSARIAQGHGARHAAGVVRYRLIREIDDGEQATVVAEIEVEPARQELVLVGALLAEAFELLIRQAHEVVEAVRLTTRLELRF